MARKYFIALILNIGIILIIFILFIFIDINISNAVRNNNISAISESTNQEKNSNISHPPYFDYIDWNSNHYLNLNLINDNTNIYEISIYSNKTVQAAFYSYQKTYYRFEINRFILAGNINPDKCYVQIYNNNEVIPSYYGPTNLLFKKTELYYTASWFHSWKPPLGKYNAVLFFNNQPVIKSEFEIIARKPVEYKKTISFINIEYNQPLLNRNIYNSSFQKTPFLSGLLDWINYGNIDALATLSGETTGWGNITPEKPWEYYPIKNLESIGTELNNKNKLVGAYIMCFYTPENGWKKAGYAPAKGIFWNNGITDIRSSSFISFKDKKRFDDIVNFAKYLDSLDYVHFIGFDFIRFGELVGYENADEFVVDMNVSTPKEWSRYSENEKIIWLGQKLQGRGNISIKERWKLWIAHKTADFIYRVRNEAGIKKPIWVFTLGWDHGKEHGQDPYFFQDAGAFSDFVMLYEATPDMFEAMKISWSDYLKDETLNYIPGNQIDAVLLKSIYGKNPIEEYADRLDWAVQYATYYSKGVFIHDITRAFWGRRGNYPYYEWLISGFSSASHARWLNHEIPYCINIIKNESEYYSKRSMTIPIEIQINPVFLSNLINKSIIIKKIGDNFIQKIDISEKTNIILDIRMNPNMGKTQWFGLYSKIDGYPPYFVFSYIKANNKNIVFSRNLKGFHN